MTATNTVDTNPASSVYAALSSKSSDRTSDRTSAKPTTEMENRFLKLLVTQLKNQDPLNPLDNAQMTSQMAQISTVSGIEKLNTTLQAMMASTSQGETMQAATLLGKGVLVPGSGLALTAADGAGFAGFDLAGPTDTGAVTINDANGVTVRTIKLGGMKAGTHTFQWDGKADNGAVAADGAYTFSVDAKNGDDKVETTALQVGMVTSIMNSSKGVSLNVGTLGNFKLTDVRQIL